MNRHRILILPTAALAAALAISACTPSASSAPQATASSAPAGGQASPPAGGGAPGGFPAGGDFAKIQQCLQAAGLTLPAGSFPLPSGSFAPPSGGFPSGQIPDGSFAPPAGAGGALNDPKVQAALKACGISLPGGPAAPSN